MRTPEDLHLTHRAVATSDKMELGDVRQKLKMGEVILIKQRSATSKAWKYFKLSGLLTWSYSHGWMDGDSDTLTDGRMDGQHLETFVSFFSNQIF